ncbi:MAG: hypothetical protein ACP5JR_00905 [Thermoplasmata archaeon]
MSKKGLSICVLLFAWLLLSCIPAPVSGDGIGIPPPQSQSSIFFEPRQEAYLRVNSDNTQTIDMFVSIVSLEPGMMVKYLVPVPVIPSVNKVKVIEEKEFRGKGLDEARDVLVLHKNGKNEFETNIKATTAFCVGSQFLTPFVCPFAYFSVYSIWFVLPMGGGVIKQYEEYGEGYSLSVINFTSGNALAEFVKGLNITLSSKVRSIVEKYKDFYFVYLNATTRPPVPENEFQDFVTACPKTYEKLKEFVKANPQMTFYSPNIYSFPDIYSVFKSEVSPSNESTLVETLNKILSVVYGHGETYKGIEIEFQMPLKDGKIFYPLGTSPSWEGNQKISLLISLPSAYFLKDLPSTAAYIPRKSENWYYIEIRNSAPDYDIVSTVSAEIFSIERTSMEISGFFYEHPASGIFLVCACFVLPWYIPFIWIARKSKIKGKPRWLFYAVPIFIGLFSFLHFLAAVYITLWCIRKFKEKEGEAKWREMTGWLRTALLSTGITVSSIPFVIVLAISLCASLGILFIAFPSDDLLALICLPILIVYTFFIAGGIFIQVERIIFFEEVGMSSTTQRSFGGENVEILRFSPMSVCYHAQISGKRNIKGACGKLYSLLLNEGFTITEEKEKMGFYLIRFTGLGGEYAVLFSQDKRGFVADIFLYVHGILPNETWLPRVDYIKNIIRAISENSCKLEKAVSNTGKS